MSNSFRIAVVAIALSLVPWTGAFAAATAEVSPPVVLVVGDSLSAGYNMRVEQGWVALLGTRVAARGLPHRVVNASISGDTTQGGVSRLPRALERHRPTVLVLELGANDGLRGIAPETTRKNLARMVAMGRAAGAKVVLIGVELPTNYGTFWSGKFHAAYLDLAQREKLPLLPTFIDAAMATDPGLMQSDGLHPNPKAQPILLDRVWPVLEPVLRADASAHATPGG